MQAEPVVHEQDAESPAANTVASNSPPSNGVSNGNAAANGRTAAAPNGSANGQFPPPKTDKPRPHHCTTCGRSFARLEHLKRHERSHTKEKPFECPECQRCFARRDLLLRHQQKLHQSGNPPRPRAGRRESVAGTSISNGARVRRTSVANANMGGANGMRPRANTLPHIDLGHFDPNHPAHLSALGLDPNNIDMQAFHMPTNFDFNGMQNPMSAHINHHGLPKLSVDTHMHNGDLSNSLRTAPPTTNFHGFDDPMFSSNTTINPAALHANDMHIASNVPFYDPNTGQMVGQDYSFMDGFNMSAHLSNGNGHNPAVFEESSPSRMSSGDSPPADFAESMNNSHVGLPPQNDFQWPPGDGSGQHISQPAGMQVDALDNGFAHLHMMGGTLSPSHLHRTSSNDTYFQQSMMHFSGHHQPAHIKPHQVQQLQQPQHSQPDQMHGQAPNVFGHNLSTFDSNSPSISSSSMAGSVSARQSSVTSMSTESITESTRQAILNTLQQPSVYGGHLYRKFSQPNVSSPLSPIGRGAVQGMGAELPSTADIRKYIDAFIQYAHPHLPMIHYPTLSFESIENSSSMRSPSPGGSSVDQKIIGSKCLLLSMAAIGALYEYEHTHSKQLFDAGRKIVALYLESERKREMSERQRSSSASADPQPPPLWLVQSMLLGVIYGHHCGEQPAAQSASQGISSLIQLMRASKIQQFLQADSDADVHMNDDEDGNELARYTTHEAYVHEQWLQWKHKEEKNRCFFAMFFVSSVLMLAYNQSPTVVNSEVVLCLPCEERLYTAATAEEWQRLGGLEAAQERGTPFKSALAELLGMDMNEKENSSRHQDRSSGSRTHWIDGELKPSTFGCLILIAALHNYIWETRAHHQDSLWTQSELDNMVNKVEPALKAWQVAWKANDQHRMERPNPFNQGPLAADCIPLLDLAFVRLYVDLGQTTIAFWARDFEQMAEELGKKKDGIVASVEDDAASNNQATQSQVSTFRTTREKQLRKAALYAADSLRMACQYNLTYADPSVSPELPIQSGICFLDCVQVLAEWSTVLQERVGPHLGMLGRDSIDLKNMPAIMLMDETDVHLLEMMQEVCNMLEQKRLQEASYVAVEIENFNPTGAGHNSMGPEVNLTGYGIAGKLTRVASMMLKKAIIWPLTQVMARALEVEAEVMDRRGEASLQHV